MNDEKIKWRSRAWVLVAISAALACHGCDAPPKVRAAQEGLPEAAQAAPCCPTDATAEEPRDPNRLWCGEHGVYEDECVICHPQDAAKQDAGRTGPAGRTAGADRDPTRLWCGGHGVYEDECLICHPELADQERTSSVAMRQELFCNEHGVPERECGICQPQLLAELAPGQGLKVRLPSDVSVTKAGVEVGHAKSGQVVAAADLLGQVSFDRNKLAVVTPLGAGVLREVLVDVGDAVQAGQLLAVVTSSSVADAKSAYLRALAEAELRRATYAREKDLHEQKISARQDYEAAKAALTASQSAVDHARQSLTNLGLTAEEVTGVVRSRSTDSSLPVRAPFAGTIVERDAAVGSLVEPGARLFLVADLSTMWMVLSIPETQLSRVRQGAQVQARFDALPGLAFEGEITWVAYKVDTRTRMVEARAVLTNAQQLLRDGLFGQVRLSGFTPGVGIAVPEAAVQVVDGRPIVFAKLDNDLFEARTVVLGAVRDGHVAVLAGLSVSDEIALNESYILKSEFLKARLGAGCTDH